MLLFQVFCYEFVLYYAKTSCTLFFIDCNLPNLKNISFKFLYFIDILGLQAVSFILSIGIKRN
ncbi:hypothetical protein BD408DRAFT_408145 [Parasitella parasitica]|nr:hypothetical protein BD408DRAFT_408145 [Parasitella parasitica]